MGAQMRKRYLSDKTHPPYGGARGANLIITSAPRDALTNDGLWPLAAVTLDRIAAAAIKGTAD